MIPIIKNISKDLLGDSAQDLLKNFNKPFWIYVDGHDQTRCRVITTLLHGNEPSGIQALHQWLLSNKKPAVNMYFFIGAVESALRQPLFSRRYLLNGQDLNRCFKAGVGQEGGVIAQNVIDLINKLNPESVLDLHNTTSRGESFAIAIQDTPSHHRLASFFTDKLVINHMKLGSLMEQNRLGLPIVTIECGGCDDPESVETAYNGIKNFCDIKDLWQGVETSEKDLIIYDKPYRLEYIEKDGKISFGHHKNNNSDLTILDTISNKNFKFLNKGHIFAYTKSKNLNVFKAFIDNPCHNYINNYFENHNGAVVLKKDLIIFMLTTNPFISKNDCVCYFVENFN